jgi:DNA-binding CsgD family transcriptional regulator
MAPRLYFDNVASLTIKEREVLHHLLLRKRLKTIAVDLDLTPSAVDQRLRSARTKLKVATSLEAAQIYADSLDATVISPEHIQCSVEPPPIPRPAVAINLSAELDSDDAATHRPVAKSTADGILNVSRLDSEYGKIWRVAAIPILALIYALLILAILSICQTISHI